jgi:hypothetical protein
MHFAGSATKTARRRALAIHPAEYHFRGRAGDDRPQNHKDRDARALSAAALGDSVPSNLANKGKEKPEREPREQQSNHPKYKSDSFPMHVR